MSEFYGADPGDLVTALVDLNGNYNGDATGFTVVRFSPGEVQADATFLSEGEIAGGEQVQVVHPPVKGSFEITAEGSTDIETLRDLFSDLAAWLDSNAVLVVQPDGQAAPIYYDTYRSPIPSMYTGGREREGVLIVDQLLVASYVFEFWHHPHPRTAGVTLASAVEVTNGTGGVNVLEAANPGGAPSEGRLQLAVNGTEHVVWALVGLKEGTLEFPSYALSGVEPVISAWQVLHRQVLTPTDPAAFAGTYRVVATYTADEDIFHFQALSGTAVDGPQGSSGPDVEHDWTDISNFQKVPLDLGTVRFDASDPRLVIEIWGRSEAGNGVGSWGEVYLIPDDLICMELASPGFLSGAYGRERYQGEDLDATGSPTVEDDGSVRLDTLNQTVFIPGVTVNGRALQVGRHVLELRGSAKNKDRTRAKQGELQVLADGGPLPIAKANIFSRRGELVTRWDVDDRRRVAWDVTDPTEYAEGVAYTEATTLGRSIDVNRLVHTYIPWVTDGRVMVVDQGARESFIADDTGARIADLHRTAALYLPPGDFTVACLIGQQSPNAYDGVDLRGALPFLSEPAVEATLDVTPRRLHP